MNIIESAKAALAATRKQLEEATALVNLLPEDVPAPALMHNKGRRLYFDLSNEECSVENLLERLPPQPLDFNNNEMKPCEGPTEFYPVFHPAANVLAGPTWFTKLGNELYRVTALNVPGPLFQAPENYRMVSQSFAGGTTMLMFIRNLREAEVRSVALTAKGLPRDKDKETIDAVVEQFASEFPFITETDNVIYQVQGRIRNVLQHRSGLSIEPKFFRSTKGSVSLRIEYSHNRNLFLDYNIRTDFNATPIHPKDLPVVLA